MPTDSAALSLAERLAEGHKEVPYGGICRICSFVWPCPPARIVEVIRSLQAENERLQEDLGRVDGALFNAMQRLAATEAVVKRFRDGFKPAPQRDGRMFWYIPDSPRMYDIQPMSYAERQVLDRLNELSVE